MRGFIIAIVLVVAAGLILWRLSANVRYQSFKDKTALYETAFKATDPRAISTLEPDSVAEKDATIQFTEFYRIYSSDSIREGVRNLYAEDAYFGDPFKSISGIDAIETYFLRMAEPVKSCTFAINGVDRSEGEYYFRWVMTLSVTASKSELIQAPGISHVRFNAQGKVIFQQDYWDSSALLEALPIVGNAVRLVKNRME